MKVKELIEKLKEFDPDLTVCFGDSQDGTQVVYEVDEYEGAYLWGDSAKVLMLDGDFADKKYFDEKYITKYIPPLRSEPIPSFLPLNLKVVFDESVSRDTVVFRRMDKPTPGGFVEFPIHKERDK